jgi:predicted ATPase/Tfp pilus assembly protein PilF
LPRPDNTNLRPSPTRFVGRRAELDRLASLFVDEGQRLVTVYGPAGTGKTRLAESLGERMRAEYAHVGGGGVWWSDLSEAGDAADICAEIARVLRLPPHPASTAAAAAELTGRAMAARGPILLVLDNFEHLVEHAAATVAAWQHAAPDARFLVTSRQPLHLAGEVRFELPPLRLPGEDGPVADCESVVLFVDRVRMRDPAFALGPDNEGIVAKLVHRLEGIPLALELAASRVELLGLAGLLESLDSRLDVLVADGRDPSDRHATLRAALESSWALLDSTESAALAQCAVFRGGFFPAAAVSVLEPTLAGRDGLALLQSLRDKSLLRRYELPEVPGRPRFRLFEAVRELADGKLAAEQRTAARSRHAAHYLATAERLAAAVGGAQGADAVARLAAERDNLLAAHASFLAAGEADAAVRTVLAIDTFAAIRGPNAAHLALLEATLGACDPAHVDARVWLRARRARGRARAMAGRTEGALRDFDAALASAADLGEERLQAEVLVDLAVGHHQKRETSTAGVLYERALAHARTCGARDIEGRILGNLGALHHDRRRLDEASARYREALAILQEVGDQRLEAIHVANLGILLQERGEFARARAQFEAALELLATLGDRRLEAIVLGNLGTLEHEHDDPQAARRVHERALGILRAVGDRRSEALCLGRLCRANAALGWIEDAQACAEAAQRIVSRFDDPVVREILAVDRAFIWEARARAGQGPEAAEALDRVQQALQRARTPDGDRPAWIERSDDVRAGVRLLDAALGRRGSSTAAARQGSALVVGPEASWLQAPAETPQDLSRRKAPRLILLTLVEHHRANPGAGVTLDDLLAAGWPGQKVVPTAAANRVYVALTTLRKLGLRKYLLSQDDGYLLDPALPVDRVAAAMPGG